jgi:hypothetical protein
MWKLLPALSDFLQSVKETGDFRRQHSASAAAGFEGI